MKTMYLTSRNLPMHLIAGLLLVQLGSQAWAQTYSIWDDSAVPAVVEAADTVSVEVGLKFRSMVNGTVTGIRFYKGAGNTGTHVGDLWTADGTLLATVEFTNESASGWQQQSLPPVAIESNTTYIVSYHMPNGRYSVDLGYFASSGVDNDPLRALADGEDGPNGLYAYGTGHLFPNQSFNSANYWVDVSFEPEVIDVCVGDTNPPVIVAPPDVILECADCDIDPTNTGTATATDECTVTVNYDDVVTGDCPKMVMRTWVATDGAGNSSSATQTITCLPPAGTASSIWDDSAVPAVVEAADPDSVELGLKFRSAISGSITGIRFYKGAGNTGPHIGSLWTATGTLLASVEFTNETASGWQQQELPPVAIESNNTYVVSYYAPNGKYSVDGDYFAAMGVDNYPLRALANGEDGPNGVYAYGSGVTFPDQSFNSGNYWVDVVFEPEVAGGCDGDTNPPVVIAPCDVIFTCSDCDLDPTNTGMPTVTDECSFTVAYHDVVLGDCPKVVKRTWVAVDGAGNTNCATQKITCLPTVVVTDSGGCSFNRDQDSATQNFRLIYTADPKNRPCYRITASNPGQFLFNAFYTGTPGQEVTIDLTLPYPFVTQGARPVHAYDWVNVDIGDSRQCYSPGNGIYTGSQLVTLASYGDKPEATTTLPVSMKVPDSGVVFLTVHLDYGLKKTTGYERNDAGDALDCATGTMLLVPNHNDYVFSVGGDNPGNTSIQNINAFMQSSGLEKLRIEKPHFKTGLVRASDSANQFGFAVTGPEAQGFVIETSTDLNQQVWTPVETNAISRGIYNFIEERGTGSPSRYYRISIP